MVDGEGPDLLGRDWMAALKVTFSEHTVEQEKSIQEVLVKLYLLRSEDA